MAASKVHRPQGSSGGNELIVESGGVITVKSGGGLTVESGGVVTLNSGASLVQPGTTAYGTGAKLPFWLELPILPQSTDGGTVASVTVVAPQKLSIIDAIFLKTGAGSSGTTVLTANICTSTDGVIVTAVNMKGILGTLGRAANIIATLGERASGSIIKCTRAGSSGTSNAGLNVEITARVLCLPRATT